MKTINAEEFEKSIKYDNVAAFVVNDGTQKMCDVCDINENTVAAFINAGEVNIYELDEQPEIAEILKENLLAAFDTEDICYKAIAESLNNNEHWAIAEVEENGTTTYMLIEP